jgi:hypothetical protein
MLRDKYNALNDSEKQAFKQDLREKIGITVHNFLERECKKPIQKILVGRLLTYIEILRISNKEIQKHLPQIAILIAPTKKNKLTKTNTTK